MHLKGKSRKPHPCRFARISIRRKIPPLIYSNWCVRAGCRNATGSRPRPVVRNWREWNLEQLQKSPSLRRVSIVGGTVFARLIGRPRVPPPRRHHRHSTLSSAFLSRHREWLSESDIEDFHGYTSVLHDSVALALFRAHLEIEPLPPCGGRATKMGWLRTGWGMADDSLPLTREGNRIAWPRSANIRRGLVGGV